MEGAKRNRQTTQDPQLSFLAAMGHGEVSNSDILRHSYTGHNAEVRLAGLSSQSPCLSFSLFTSQLQRSKRISAKRDSGPLHGSARS